MQDSKHRFPYEWKLSDGFPAKGIESHKSKVFSCFACGGGSSMGYKLAGYDCLGGVELDPNIAAAYLANLHPQIFYTQDIREFNERTDLPEVLYNLDVLDGSPPCSTFSMAGSREKAWGKRKQFAEGQKLQPKVHLLENVSGLVKGNGKAYSKEIISKLSEAGYRTQLFLLNAATMGVPQMRERVFFIGLRKDFDLPRLVLDFKEPAVLGKEICDYLGPEITGEKTRMLWENRVKGDHSQKYANMRLFGVNANFGQSYLYEDKVSPTLTTKGDSVIHFEKPHMLSDSEKKRISSFPQDYETPTKDIGWLCGMSVPPIMTAQISYQIWKQWLSRING